MNESIWQVIARLRRAQPRNPDTMAVCDALEDLLRAAAKPQPSRPVAKPKKESQFDRKAYMREYMRKYMPEWRAKAKARKTD